MVSTDKMTKWLKWIGAIENDMIQVLSSRQFYKEYGRIVSSNNSINTEGSLFHRWVIDNYVTYVAMAIRRQLDDYNDVISLKRLVQDIANNPNDISRSEHVKLFSSLPPLVDGNTQGNQSFDKLAGSGQYFDPQIAVDDLSLLENDGISIMQLVNRKFAHNSKNQSPIMTFDDVDEVIETLKSLVQKYMLLITATHSTLEPVIGQDWQDIFTKAWINLD